MIRTRHDHITQAFHWAVALLVIFIYAIGLGREGLPKGDLRTALLGLHMSLGIVLGALLVLRMGWRAAAPPVAPVPMGTGLRVAAKLGHIGLYLLLLAVPIIGLFGAWIKGRMVGVFGLPLPSPFVIDAVMAKRLEDAHEVSANILMALAGIHALAALVHHLVLKDDTLRRMLPHKHA